MNRWRRVLRCGVLPSILILMLFSMSAESRAQNDLAFDALADVIVDQIGETRPARFALARFEIQPDGLENPLTYEFRHQLAQALAKIEGIELVALDRLENWTRAGHLDSFESMLTQDATFVDFMIQGTVFQSEHGHQLLVEIVEAGSKRRFTETAWIERDTALAARSSQITAHHAASMQTVREVYELSRDIGQDFRLRLWVGEEGRRTYQIGERIEYFVSSERDAYVAVICHQHDGISYPLLPNSGTSDNFFRGGQIEPIARNDAFEIKASTPGVDVIQAIACERPETIDEVVGSLHRSSAAHLASSKTLRAGRSSLFTGLRRNLAGRNGDRCASAMLEILVNKPSSSTEPRAPVEKAVKIKIGGLDTTHRMDVLSALEASSGIQRIDHQGTDDGIWLLEISGAAQVSDLEEVIASHLPNSLMLLDRTEDGIEFGPPPIKGQRAEKIWFFGAIILAILRWLTG